MSDDLKKSADALAPELVRLRRSIHRQPELGFEETRTSGLVESRLKELGLEVHSGLATTGVVGILRANSSSGPAVLLRADMDALPIQEIEGREYGSEVAGCMHACGHDGHTAMLLGAASMLCERRQELTHDVVFCFQPAEEGGGGGEKMIEEGVLDIVETGTVYGLHLWSPSPVGTLHVRPGAFMAAVDEFTARIIGRGGHGAMPHCNVDPVVAASQAVVALQSVVSRNVDPIEPAVVTVGALQAGTAGNIIPDEALLRGTMRSFDEGVRTLLRERVQEVLDLSARAAGCRLEFELTCGYPAVINDPRSASLARTAANDVFGEENVFEPAPLACAEDFSFFLQQRPGAFMFVGAGNVAKGIDAPHHSPRFDIDEDALPRGAELLARLALRDDHPV
jgi:amidohydrolase